MLLAGLQGHYIKTNKVFADINLLKACLSIPTLYRQNKNIIDEILMRHFKSHSFSKYGNISSRFLWGKGYAELMSFISFRFLNFNNSFLRFLTQGRFQLKNKYQTEEHERLLHANFKHDLRNATSKFLALGIFTEEQKIFFDKLPIRSIGISDRYSLISLSKLL
jgi:hypothetical protein